jgi:hypothetical protein
VLDIYEREGIIERGRSSRAAARRAGAAGRPSAVARSAAARACWPPSQLSEDVLARDPAAVAKLAGAAREAGVLSARCSAPPRSRRRW